MPNSVACAGAGVPTAVEGRLGCNSLTFSLCECDLKGNTETRWAIERFCQDVRSESAVLSSFVLISNTLKINF